MRVRPLLTALVSGASLLVLSACGSDGGGGGGPASRGSLVDLPSFFMGPEAVLFLSFDSNGNRIVEPSELDSGTSASFTRADVDGNGRVSAIELGEWCLADLGNREAMSMMSFGVMSDQQIDATAFGQGLRARWNGLDRNRDGNLQRSELWSEMPSMQTGPRQPRERVRDYGGAGGSSTGGGTIGG